MSPSLRFVLVFLFGLITLSFTAHATLAAAPTISPDLAAEVQRAAPDAHIPVMIVMREQADVPALLPQVAELTPNARRSFARTELERHATVTQARVRAHLDAEVLAGRAANVRSLWIASGLLAELSPDGIRALLEFTEIRTILWDPLVPDEEANDPGEALPATPTPGVRAGGELWQLESVNAPDVWALGYEGENVIVAIEDNGVDRFHPDIASHIWDNPNEIPGNLVDDDDNGYVDDFWGWDFVSNDNEPLPAGDDHGTKCAGIVAGDGTNGTRTGVAPKALIMGCRVSSWGQNILGIQYAIDNGAHVISMSRSEKWRFNPKPDYDWWRSITDGELLSGIFHANSIGNEGDNQNTDPIPFNIAAPGCCPTPYRHPDQVQAGVSGIVSGCGALDINDVIANYSSRGPFAWEDIMVNWPEYPYPMRPEYQDYPVSGSLPGLLKPDVVAPGPGTTSIGIGGGYGSFGGTSAATPHVAGGIALILSANPFLTPEEMGMVLQSTAVDLGAAGKDNVYGAGKLDCLAAVELALLMNDFGLVQGNVTDQSNGSPIAEVDVEAVGDIWNAKTDVDGDYSIGLPAGDWTLRYRDFFYEDGFANISIEAQETVVQDVVLVPKPTGTISGRVRDVSGFAIVAGADLEIPNTPIPSTQSDASGAYSYAGIPVGSYSVLASKFGYEPGSQGANVTDGGVTTVDFFLTPALIAEDMESDPAWTVGATGDDATTGVWVRDDPLGTGAQPENDHTPDPGVQCWFTGQGTPGGTIGENDVDGGKTSLVTSVMDLTSAPDPVVSYWAWYSNDQGSATDDEWVVEISNDGGTSWIDLVRRTASTSGWEQFEHRVADFLAPTAAVQVRFVASDEGSGSIVEAAVDDFQVFGDSPATSTPSGPDVSALRLALHPNAPNPFASTTMIRFALPAPAEVELNVFDVSGRLVRSLASGERREAGVHHVRWDGTDARGRRVASGVYFYRVDALGQSAARRMVRLK